MKYRGRIKVSFELLKELLKLEDNVDITNVIRTEDDQNYETFTIYLSSDEKSSFTYNVPEGAKIPLSDYRGINV